MKQISWTLALLVALGGCNTTRQSLELKRDQLARMQQNAVALREVADAGSLNPGGYDAYLNIQPELFSQMLQSFDGFTTSLGAGTRPVEIKINSVRLAFRTGTPELVLDLAARDVKTGLTVGIDTDARLILERDATDPDKLFGRIAVTRLVPKANWGPLDFTKARFVRAVLSLEAIKYTERLPRFAIPVTHKFAFGGPAVTQDSGQIPTGDGSWIRGNIALPATLTEGIFAIKQIVFLKNGVHLFANVEQN
jgi:hypothetical protein